MNVTNLEVLAAKGPLEKLLKQYWPVGVSYKLAKLALKLREPLDAISKVRNGLIEKYGTKDEKGRSEVKEDSPTFEAFQKEWRELLDQEVELVFEKVKLPEIAPLKCEKCGLITEGAPQVEPMNLLALEKFVGV